MSCVLLSTSWVSAIGCCRGLRALRGQGAINGGAVVFCGVSDWLRGQLPPKLLHSVPQCCSHCPRNRRPTHSLTSSPHFNRKFISSTYGLEGTHGQPVNVIYSKRQNIVTAGQHCMSERLLHLAGSRKRCAEFWSCPPHPGGNIRWNWIRLPMVSMWS